MLKKLLSICLAALMLSLPLLSVNAFAEDSVISVGKSYTVEYENEIKNAYPLKEYKPETKLTDGVTDSTAKYSNPAWVEFYRGTAVNVTIDLGETMSVSRVNLGQLQYSQPGIYCSRWVEVQVSEDGESFGLAGRVDDPNKTTSAAVSRVAFDISFEKSYKARYVKVSFSSDVFTYVDEISVYGNGDASSAEAAPAVSPKEEPGFAKPIDGISNLSLMYTTGNYNAEQLKYYFAYHDKDGKPTDLMFDSLLFLSLPTASAKDGYMRQNEIVDYLANALASDKNIGALNQAVGELKDDIGYDKKYPIFISMPYIGVYNGSFGEINGEAVGSATLEQRKAIAEWFVDYVIAEFEKCCYENLELKGIYWFEESIHYSTNTNEEELIKHFNEYTQAKNLKTVWIPYYVAAGIDKVPELGFDAVVMQPGYAFNGGSETGEPKPEVVEDCAKIAKKYGMGMEFEVDMNVEKYLERFKQYVHVAYKEGLMTDGIMMMYQVSDHLYQSAVSAGKRELYDLTYKYNSGTYSETTPVIEGEVTLTLNPENHFYSKGKFTVTDPDTPSSKLKAVFEKIPGVYLDVYGTGGVEAQCTEETPAGTYKTEISLVDDYGNESNKIQVTVIVEGTSGSAESVAESEGSEPGTEKTDNKTLWIIICGAAAVVVLAAVAVIILKSKKNK